MNYAKVRSMDISNGPGFRVSIFFQGCEHQCKNCFNPETWNPKHGKPWTEEHTKAILNLCDKPEISGISLLGGDPLFWFSKRNESYYENRSMLLDFMREFKQRFPDKTIWLWTGYTWEHIVNGDAMLDPLVNEITKYVDVIVDGLFIEELKVPNLKWRGSTNQRIIDVKKSLQFKEVILYE